jgi:hypothetical protein
VQYLAVARACQLDLCNGSAQTAASKQLVVCTGYCRMGLTDACGFKLAHPPIQKENCMIWRA